MGNPDDPNDPGGFLPGADIPDPDGSGGGFGGRIRWTDPPVPAGPEPSPAPAPDPWAGKPDNYGTVRGYYQQLLGRDAENPDVVANWLNGTHGNLDQVRSGIAATDEAKAYAARQTTNPGTTTPPPASYGDDASILAQIAQWGAMPGADPSLKNDPNYWLGAIKSRGGLNAGNLKFWQDASVGPTAFFNNPNRERGNGGPSISGTGPAPGQGNGTNFADPAYQALNALAQARITSLQQPQSFPQLDSLMQQLQAQQAVNKQRAADLASKWGSRVTELQQPLLTQPQVVQQRAMAENRLLESRDAAIANARANQSARGFAPTSGLAADRQRQIEENASDQQGQIDARLMQANIGTDEARRNEATKLQGLITQALNGGDATALQEQAQVADLENQLYQTDQQRQTQQLAAAQIPVDLTNTGFNNASSAISSPTSAFASLMPLIQASLTGQRNQFDQSNSQSNGLSQLLQRLFGMI